MSPQGDGLVGKRIRQILGFFHGVAEFFKTAAGQGLLEEAGVPGGAGGMQRHSLAGMIGVHSLAAGLSRFFAASNE